MVTACVGQCHTTVSWLLQLQHAVCHSIQVLQFCLLDKPFSKETCELFSTMLCLCACLCACLWLLGLEAGCKCMRLVHLEHACSSWILSATLHASL